MRLVKKQLKYFVIHCVTKFLKNMNKFDDNYKQINKYQA